MSRPPLPPFTLETAKVKVRKAEDAWNTRIPRLLLSPIRRTLSGEIVENFCMAETMCVSSFSASGSAN